MKPAVSCTLTPVQHRYIESFYVRVVQKHIVGILVFFDIFITISGSIYLSSNNVKSLLGT